MIFSSLPAAGLAQAQTGDRAGVTAQRSSTETLRGLVLSVSHGAAEEGLPAPVYLTLKTAQEKVRVLLGPRRYVDQQPLKITPLDRIEVTGFKVEVKGEPGYFVASEIKKGDQIMKLRDQEGRPLWGGAGIR